MGRSRSRWVRDRKGKVSLAMFTRGDPAVVRVALDRDRPDHRGRRGVAGSPTTVSCVRWTPATRARVRPTRGANVLGSGTEVVLSGIDVVDVVVRFGFPID